MRLLLDNKLSPKLVALLIEAGHDVTHVGDHEMAADDRSVLALAAETRRVLVSADTDFGTLLAGRTPRPRRSCSFVGSPGRWPRGRGVAELAAVIVDNLPVVEDDLAAVPSWCWAARVSGSGGCRSRRRREREASPRASRLPVAFGEQLHQFALRLVGGPSFVRYGVDGSSWPAASISRPTRTVSSTTSA